MEQLGYSYGVTEFLQLKGTIIADRLEERDWHVAAFFAESVVQIIDIKKTGFGFSWYTAGSAGIRQEEADSVLFGPIVKFAHKDVSLTLNPFFEKTFGDNQIEGIAFDYGWQFNVGVTKGVTLSLAGFGHIDDLGHAPPVSQQEHKIGPLIAFETELSESRKLALETGVFFGMTEATPDTAFKVKLSYTH